MSIQKSAKIIRKDFLDYFISDLGHTFIRSSPVSPINDRTLAFVNAGMNQFKSVFLDKCDAPAPKVANSQKCIRVGGKHNDLNVVGHDTNHHTFFEMLGTWSFNNYFKESACQYAWSLLTGPYGIKKEFLYVTYFAGDNEMSIPPDFETKDIWLRIGVPKNRILPFGCKENFWEMGPTGPCGPCTEIHIDSRMQTGNHNKGSHEPIPSLMELWNIVFIQYERLPNGSVVALPKYHVDTGMGFERLVALLQGKKSNYDSDIFQPLFESIHKYTGSPKYKGLVGNDDKNEIDYGYRILADHARMITVAIADGILPDQNPKLRRILRKAIDISEQIFKKSGVLYELVYTVADNLGDFYPELQTNLKQVHAVVQFEDNLLKKLRRSCEKEWKLMVATNPKLSLITDWMAPGLINGYKDLQTTLKEMCPSKVLTGSMAFKLYDTYGLNSNTIAELAEVESLHFDEIEFYSELELLRQRSRTGSGSNAVSYKALLEKLENSSIEKTDDSLKYEYTIQGNNYKFPIVKSKLLGMIFDGSTMHDAIDVNKLLNAKNEIGIILNKTPCYSQAGGQTSDKGIIDINGHLFNIADVIKINDYVIHLGNFSTNISTNQISMIQIGDDCIVLIDAQVRTGAMKHHTATHLVNGAVKRIFKAAFQRGSIVNADCLSFQFNPFGEKLTHKHVAMIETLVNDVIKRNIPITTKILDSCHLIAEDNVTFITGETYPQADIRLVEIADNNFTSKEPCCGTHVRSTGELLHFTLIEYISKGSLRCRINAVVGPLAESAKINGERMQQSILHLKTSVQAGIISYAALSEEIAKIKSQLKNTSKETQMSYLSKQACLDELTILDKAGWTKQKEMDKAVMISEITNAAGAATPSFVVHSLTKIPESLSLNEVIKLLPNVPVFIMLYKDKTVKARCQIPREMVSDSFNASSWMNVALQAFKVELKPSTDSKSILTANMNITHIQEISAKTLITKAITETTEFVSRYTKN